MTSSSTNSARSLVNNYELMLLETRHSSLNPSSTQLQKCFKMFDEILPMLGQYQRVLKLIRDDIYEAVFSQKYTVVVESDGPVLQTNSDERSSIERVPHFVILGKIVEERNRRAEEAEEQLKQSKIVIEELNAKIGELNRHIAGLEVSVETQTKEIQDLKTVVARHIQENSKLKKELGEQQQDSVNKTKIFESSVDALNAEIAHKNTQVVELSRFKKSHDDAQDGFRDSSVFSSIPQRGIFSPKEQKLRKDIAEGETLEKQLLKLRNVCIHDFEQYLEKCVLEEEAETYSGAGRQSSRLQNDHSIAKKVFRTEDKHRHETAFTNTIANIENELEQNKLHLSILKAGLGKLKQIKRDSQSASKGKVVYISDFHRGSSKYGQPNSSIKDDESELLGVIKNASKDYQFLPQEHILSKYAITVFYSCNHGKTFHELQNVQHCHSCGQKTLVCPHKVTSTERIVHLPLQCTHIKFSRPGLPAVALQTEPRLEVNSVSSNSALSAQPQNVYARLWRDLTERENSSKPPQKMPRVVEERYLVSLITQFYASLALDDSAGGDDALVPILESWYAFLLERYLVPSVVVLVARDILETIVRTETTNNFVQLFTKCLTGDLDPAVFRYYLSLTQLIRSVQWTSMEEFSCFAKIAYPFMNGDDLENFTMSYTSFSENKISSDLICEFLISIILKQREPYFHEMERKLLGCLENRTAFMNDVIFSEVMAEISPLSSERLCHRLFSQSNADTEENDVSISRLSQIASYLDLHQRTAVMKMEIGKKLQLV